jgi:hypothetical protein
VHLSQLHAVHLSLAVHLSQLHAVHPSRLLAVELLLHLLLAVVAVKPFKPRLIKASISHPARPWFLAACKLSKPLPAAVTPRHRRLKLRATLPRLRNPMRRPTSSLGSKSNIVRFKQDLIDRVSMGFFFMGVNDGAS